MSLEIVSSANSGFPRIELLDAVWTRVPAASVAKLNFRLHRGPNERDNKGLMEEAFTPAESQVLSQQPHTQNPAWRKFPSGLLQDCLYLLIGKPPQQALLFR